MDILIYYIIKQHLINQEKKIPFAQAGTKLNNIGVFIIHTKDNKKNEDYQESQIDISKRDEVLEQESLKVTRGGKEIYVDKEMNQYINDKFDSFSDILNQIIGKTDFNLNIYELGSTDRQPSKQLSRINENILCNLITDSMRYFGEADISIMNAGTIRADIDQGDITYQEVINTMPYSNDVSL